MFAAGMSEMMGSNLQGSRPASMHAASPFFPGMQMHTGKFGSMPNQPMPLFGAGMQGNHQSSAYQFPNPFALDQGPHRAGFGNGFTMQQMPSVLGQMGAQFSMPAAHAMGRPASSGAAFSF